MADKKISALPAATTPLTGAEVLPIVQSGATVQATNNDLRPKQIQSNATSGVLQVVGPAASTARVMTTPNANFTAARTDAAQTFTGDNTFNGTTTVSAAEAYLALDADTLGAGNLWYVISGGGGNVSPGYLSFFNGNGGNKVMTIAPSTTEQFTTDLSGNFNLVTGNLVLGTAAKGIDFSANTSAPGMTSELLGWYEEGVWTPVVVPSSGAITTQTCSGRYTRIGRLVTVQLSIVINDVGTAGSISSISGLPFTSANTLDVGSGSLREYNSTGLEWNFTVNPNATTIFAAQYNNSTAISTSYGWRGSLSYFV
jgi:hypothetical protein